MLVDVGPLSLDNGDLPLNIRILQIEVGASPPQGLPQGSGPVGGQHHKGDGFRPHRPRLGDGHLHFAEQLQQERLELLVGFVDLVNEQHHRLLGPDRPQQGPLQQVFVAEEGPGQIVRVPPVHLHLDAQQLLLVIPLVEGLALVQALVALEAHQLPVQGGGHDLGDFGFSYAGGALNEQGPVQPEGHQ